MEKLYSNHMQKKQEANGPQHSPEKTVQINEQIRLYHNFEK